MRFTIIAAFSCSSFCFILYFALHSAAVGKILAQHPAQMMLACPAVWSGSGVSAVWTSTFNFQLQFSPDVSDKCSVSILASGIILGPETLFSSDTSPVAWLKGVSHFSTCSSCSVVLGGFSRGSPWFDVCSLRGRGRCCSSVSSSWLSSTTGRVVCSSNSVSFFFGVALLPNKCDNFSSLSEQILLEDEIQTTGKAKSTSPLWVLVVAVNLI